MAKILITIYFLADTENRKRHGKQARLRGCIDVAIGEHPVLPGVRAEVAQALQAKGPALAAAGTG